MTDLDRCTHGRYRIDHCLDCGRKYVGGELTGPFLANDEPCLCGTAFTCLADEHTCGNCGAHPVTCECDES